MKHAKYIFFFLIIIALTACAEQKPQIVASDAVITPSPMMGNAYSAFLVIENKGNVDDSLIGFYVEGINAKFELHDVVGGKMVAIPEIKIPAKSKVELKRGSLHLMIINPDKKLENEVTIVLKFKKSGEIKIKGKVMSPKVKEEKEEEMTLGCG